MAWSVNDIFNFTKVLTRKNQSASISATDLFYQWNAEQNSYKTDLLGKWQARNNGKSGMNTGLILDETSKTLLAPFTLPSALSVVAGLCDLPIDYIFGVGGARLLVSGVEYKVIMINHNQIWDVNQDVIDPPSIADGKYYAVSYEDYLSFLPITAAGTLHLDYIAECTDIVWGYTLDVDNRQVYDSATSVQPKWNTPTIIDITKRTLAGFGVAFHDRDFQAFGKSNIVTGDS